MFKLKMIIIKLYIAEVVNMRLDSQFEVHVNPRKVVPMYPPKPPNCTYQIPAPMLQSYSYRLLAGTGTA